MNKEKTEKIQKKKNPIWNFFKNCSNDKSRAVCEICGESKVWDQNYPTNKLQQILKKTSKIQAF